MFDPYAAYQTLRAVAARPVARSGLRGVITPWIMLSAPSDYAGDGPVPVLETGSGAGSGGVREFDAQPFVQFRDLIGDGFDGGSG